MSEYKIHWTELTIQQLLYLFQIRGNAFYRKHMPLIRIFCRNQVTCSCFYLKTNSLQCIKNISITSKDFPITMILSRYTGHTSHQTHRYGKLKSTTLNWNRLVCVAQSFLLLSSSFMITCQYLILRSSMGNKHAWKHVRMSLRYLEGDMHLYWFLHVFALSKFRDT